jgi:hypothetical protein
MELELDDDVLDALCHESIVKGLAVDYNGHGWASTAFGAPAAQSVESASSAIELSASAALNTQADGANLIPNVSAQNPMPRSTKGEAERRQLTVMF